MDSKQGLRPISEIAAEAGLPGGSLVPYGSHIAKVRSSLLDELAPRPESNLVLVTAMSPTPAGVGKTTLTIGLAQSLRLLGKKAFACIRQPSMGPLLGSKGGATGSGRAMVEPAEQISLHFTGDDHAVAAAHNLVASIMDNHVYHGNALGIEKPLWSRVAAVNDRSLRRIRSSVGTPFEREEGFHISAASELMAILSLSRGLEELKARVARATVAFGRGTGVTIADLKVDGAAAALLKNALDPNLVQSVEGAPVFVHTGPFGNISIGCSSLLATSMALRLGDYVLTEAGFSTELGAEKFFNIVCRAGGLRPAAALIVASVEALRLHGWTAPGGGFDNLAKHIENIEAFGVPAVVVLNRHRADTEADAREALSRAEALGARAVHSDVRERGGPGGLEAAAAIVEACSARAGLRYLYPLEMSVEDKISVIAGRMYGAEGVELSDQARAELEGLDQGLPVCIAKTPRSLSDDPSLSGRPSGFRITVRSLRAATGAGYIVAMCGSVLLMPGMPARPLAEAIGVDGSGSITGI